ncbi:Fe-S oxidoreductase [Methanocella sp. CWC-04]|uniref:Fe-S oxidoreductase n=1 Tax=Methanooceanicella nereidis TaxID=2052831 RepID=A0AAP2RDS6_9EURY|nr:Fe-S oxidoreductase [Methanocella sp. CWC-04]
MIEIANDRIYDRIEDLKAELSELIDYPEERFIEIIKDVGFECDLCGKCCTREFNDHAFLLDADVDRIKMIDPDALVPAPYYEYCDQHGRFYVSGYALRFKADGSCYFLENGRCRIYDERPAICRIYPYMLHREEGEDGKVDWRQISGLNEHGFYNADIEDEVCRKMAVETKEYEAAFLNQEIRFSELIQEHFEKNGLKHVKGVYDRRIRQFKGGAEIEVFVFHNGALEKNTVTKTDH